MRRKERHAPAGGMFASQEIQSPPFVSGAPATALSFNLASTYQGGGGTDTGGNIPPMGSLGGGFLSKPAGGQAPASRRHIDEAGRHGPLADVGKIAAEMGKAQRLAQGASVKACLEWLQVRHRMTVLLTALLPAAPPVSFLPYCAASVADK